MHAQVGDGVFEVLSTSGDTHLGGDDFDKRIVDYMASDFQKSEGIDLRKDRQALQRWVDWVVLMRAWFGEGGVKPALHIVCASNLWRAGGGCGHKWAWTREHQVCVWSLWSGVSLAYRWEAGVRVEDRAMAPWLGAGGRNLTSKTI